jgi:hypothetical protein
MRYQDTYTILSVSKKAMIIGERAKFRVHIIDEGKIYQLVFQVMS